MNLNATIRRMINRSSLHPLIALIPGSVSGAAYDTLVARIFRNQKAKVLATWPQ